MDLLFTFLRVLAAKLWALFAAVIITAALLLGLLRLLLPLSATLGIDVVGWVERTLGQPVRIGAMDARWHGLGPKLTLTAVRLLDATGHRTVAELDEARVGLDVIASLRRGVPVVSDVTVVGAHVSLLRRPDGSVVMRGVAADSAPGGAGLPAWIFEQPRLLLKNSQVSWQDQREGRPALSFKAVNLALRNEGARHLLEGSAQLGSTMLILRADLRGDPANLSTWRGQVYARCDAVRLADWLRQGSLPGLYVSAGEGNFSLWGQWDGARLQELDGQASVRGLDLRRAGSEGSYVLDALNGRFSWRREDSGWSLDGDRLAIARGESRWPGGAFRVESRAEPGGGARDWDLWLSFLRLQDAVPLLRTVGLPTEGWEHVLGQAQPRGDLEDWRIHWRIAGNGPEDLSYSGRFTAAGVSAWGRFPAVDGLDGLVEGTATGGRITVRGVRAHVRYDLLFREPFPESSIQGRFSWSRDAEGLRVRSKRFAARNADIALWGRMDLLIPRNGASPWLGAHVEFADGDGAQTSRYLPAHIMPLPAVEWLDRSIVRGRVISGGALFHGPLRAFPFDHGEGKFQVKFRLLDGVLDYKEQWPRLDGIDAVVAFDGRRMDISASAGTLFDSQVIRARVAIPDLGSDHPVLDVDGQARGPTADVLRFLRESPLRARLGKYVRDTAADGESGLGLQLKLPLTGGEPQIAGQVDFDGSGLRLGQWDLRCDGVSGRLNFSGDGVSASGIRLQLLGQPATLGVASRGAGRVPRTVIDVASDAKAETLKRLLPPTLLGHATGKAPYRATLRLRDEPTADLLDADLHLESSLVGLAVDLPPPLHKTSNEAIPFDLDVDLGAPGYRRLSLHYGKRLSAVLALREEAGGMRLERGAVHFGTGDVHLPSSPGMYLTGELPELSLSAWQGALEELGVSVTASVGHTASALLGSVDVKVGTLQAFGRELSDVGLQLRPAASGWSTTLGGPTLGGQVFLPAPGSGLPITANMDHVRLAPLQDELWEEVPDPRDFPPLLIKVSDFRYDGHELGRLSLQARHQKDGLRVDGLEIVSSDARITASGEWLHRDRGGLSRFDIELSSRDLGAALRRLGYQGGIAEGKTKMRLGVRWAGPPSAFALGRVDGRLELKVEKGRLLEISPGAGRVFGLLSLQALPRRLTLDFNDLFMKGFSFDRIEGQFTIDDGNAYTNDLTMDGPAARIEVSGRTGLAERDYDQFVTIIPHMSSTLSVAGALAGGPQVGAALAIVQKLFESKIERMTQYQYSVTGSWEDPKVERLQGEPITTQAP